MARGSLREAIARQQRVLLDGAVGTELYNRGIFINRCFEDANLTAPHLVQKLHEEYLQAGAEALTTNSWGANYLKLSGHSLHDKIVEINRQAVLLAKDVAGDDAWIFASVGPLGVRIEPFGPTALDEAQEYFAVQIEALAAAGADCILFETFADINELKQGILAARRVAPQLPIVALTVLTEECCSPLGTSIDTYIATLERLKVDVLGFNCSVGPVSLLTCVERARKLTAIPLCVRPNAGLPKMVGGRHIYMSTPDYMAKFTSEFFQSGVQFVGGCCGTSPAHIRAMANAMRHADAMQPPLKIAFTKSEPNNSAEHKEPTPTITRVALKDKSHWAKKIASGEKVTSLELLPPLGVNPEAVLQRAAAVKKAGIDAINIPDGPCASSRMSALLTAVMIEQKVGIETILHYTCRDRNLLGMQSDIIGAQAIGLRNILAITGDPPKMGTYPNATGVFDVDAIGLTNMIHRLNGGFDLGGRPIGEPASISLGVGVNPAHRDFDHEMKRFAWKVDAGAEWAITQPVFDIAALSNFLDYLERNKIRIPIICGIWPLVSYRNALFMQNEVPGVVIPTAVIERMAKPNTPEDAKKVGVDIAREMYQAMRSSIQGVQLSAPFGRIDLALQVIAE
jgi:homocysteine S-methyltransferase